MFGTIERKLGSFPFMEPHTTDLWLAIQETDPITHVLHVKTVMQW